MGRRKKRRTHVKDEDQPQISKSNNPRSFVLRRGRHSTVLKDLEDDLRQVMQPNTATSLKESKKNSLKDFVHVAGPLGVTHFMILSATQKASYLRVATVPRGPTLTMVVHEYTLAADIAAQAKNYSAPTGIFKTPPLVVLNNFVGEKHLRLAAVVCQNLFPAINVKTVKLATCKRVVLLDFDAESECIFLRHYHITAQPAGVSKRIRRLVTKRDAPSMKGLNDIAEYLGGMTSDSEGEDTAARVMLAQDMGRANSASTQSSIKLQELGPRMTLELIKLEEGVCSGQVLYHKYVEKTSEEVAELVERKETNEKLRTQRREEQAENVVRKRAEKEALRQAERARQGIKDRTKEPSGAGDADSGSDAEEEEDRSRVEEQDDEESDDTDTEWYRREVGEEPDEQFKRNVKARKLSQKENAERSEQKRLERSQLQKREARKPGSTPLAQEAADKEAARLQAKKDQKFKDRKGQGGKDKHAGGGRTSKGNDGGKQAKGADKGVHKRSGGVSGPDKAVKKSRFQ